MRPWIAMLAVLAVLSSCAGGTSKDPVYQGIIELTEVTLGFEVGGRVLELDVEEGTHVEDGDPVARLSASLAELEVEAKEAELSAARADLGVLAEGS